MAIGGVDRCVGAPGLARHIGGRRASSAQFFNCGHNIVGGESQECALARLFPERLSRAKYDGRLGTGRFDFQSARAFAHICIHDNFETENVSVELQSGVLIADVKYGRGY